MNRHSSYPLELSDLIRGMFDSLYRNKVLYRATGITLADLVPDTYIRYNLFEDLITAEKIKDIYEAVDILNRKYGKHTLHLADIISLKQTAKEEGGNPQAETKLN